MPAQAAITAHLLAGEGRWAFLQECRDTFDVVVRAAHCRLRLAFSLELLLQRAVPGITQNRACGHQRLGRHGRQTLRERQRAAWNQPQPWVLLGGLLLLLLAIAPAVLAWRRRERHSASANANANANANVINDDSAGGKP